MVDRLFGGDGEWRPLCCFVFFSRSLPLEAFRPSMLSFGRGAGKLLLLMLAR